MWIAKILFARVTPAITWDAPAAIVHGTALGPDQLDASADEQGTFVYTPPAGTVLGPGAGQTLSALFTPEDRERYAEAEASVTIDVYYDWSGVLAPIDARGGSVFKLGSAVPVRFKLVGASAAIANAEAWLSYRKVENGTAGPATAAVSTSSANAGNLFRYDAGARQYVFNWSTRAVTTGPGVYELLIDLHDGATRIVRLTLR
jgi:hypothetical protein